MARDIDIMDAWTLGEQTLYKELLTATQGTDGKNAFLGHLPPMTNAWALFVGGGDTEHNLAGCWNNIIVNVEIQGRFNERTKATDFIGLVLKAFQDGQFSSKENIQDLQLDEMPEINDVQTTIGKDDRPTLHFEVSFSATLYLITNTTFN